MAHKFVADQNTQKHKDSKVFNKCDSLRNRSICIRYKIFDHVTESVIEKYHLSLFDNALVPWNPSMAINLVAKMNKFASQML